MTEEHETPEEQQEQIQHRLLLPLLMPVIIFIFAVLVIYALSRIFLDLSHVEWGDEVNAATPLAIGVMLGILLVCWYLASNPRTPAFVVAGIVLVAGALLTGGSILAAVTDEPETEAEVPGDPTEPSDGPDGGISVDLTEFSVTADPGSAPAGSTPFTANNVGAIAHNLHVIATDLAPDALPVVDGVVDLAALESAGETDDINPGESEELQVELAEGTYVLICNVPAHYEGGMYTGFEVGPAAPGGAPPAEGGEPPAEGGDAPAP
jgi:uncharacterized cupredoxin-like copper-binding protein